jgi:hypothetical protein
MAYDIYRVTTQARRTNVRGMTTKRMIGLMLLAVAGFFGIADLWQTYVPSYGAEPLTLGRLWLLVSAQSFGIAEDLVHRRLWAPLWDFGVAPLLIAPAWSFFGVLGFVLIALGRTKTVER